jgi:hypothetical protein
MQEQIDDKELINRINAIKKFQRENLIYQFGNPKYWHWNSFQQTILKAWMNWALKVFLATGANRKGKTTLGVSLAFATLFGELPWSGEKLYFPHDDPRRVLYVGQGWETHIQKVVEPEMKKLWPKQRPVETKKNNMGVLAHWTDGITRSELFVASNNQESDAFEGDQYDLIVWDEPPKRENRVAAARGLIDRQGRELIVATLIKEAWVHREIIKARLENGEPDLTVFHADGDIYDNVSRCMKGHYIQRFIRKRIGTVDGPEIGICECGETKDFIKFGLTLDGVDTFAKKLKGDEKTARLLGRPSYLGNLVLPKLDRRIHIKKRFDKWPLNWITDVSIDFHPSKPWDVLFVATDPRNFKWAHDYLHTHGSPKFIAEEIVRKAQDNHYNINSITIDPLAKGDENARGLLTTFDVMEEVLAAFNYSLETASKDKDNGIIMINDLLMTENEMPGLFVFDDMGIVWDQLEDWSNDPDTGRPSKKQDDDFCELLYRIILKNTQYYDPTEQEREFPEEPERPYDPLGRAHA